MKQHGLCCYIYTDLLYVGGNHEFNACNYTKGFEIYKSCNKYMVIIKMKKNGAWDIGETCLININVAQKFRFLMRNDSKL